MALEKKFIAGRKKDLLAQKERLEKELGAIAKKKGKKFDVVYTDYGNSDEENAEEHMRYTFNLALDRNLEKLLGQTMVSLDKIRVGTYGVCEGCGIAIRPERLEAFPAAAYCITCQADYDNPIKRMFAKFRNKKKVS